MSAAEVRRQLMEQKGYTDEELPSRQTINTKLRELDYYPRRVVKSKPKKKIPETDAIFEQLAEVNSDADEAPDTLRISIDAKAQVKIGPFSRGGKNRVTVEASDSRFQAESNRDPIWHLSASTGRIVHVLYDIESHQRFHCRCTGNMVGKRSRMVPTDPNARHQRG